MKINKPVRFKAVLYRVEVQMDAEALQVILDDETAQKLEERGIIEGYNGTASKKEPKDQAPVKKSGPLPEDFPGLKALSAAGVETYEDLSAMDKESVLEIPGIGASTYEDIANAVLIRE